MSIPLQKAITVLNAEFVGESPDFIFDHISIDSRSLQNGRNTLFFALKGPQHDGHDYIEALIQKGVSCFVVQEL